MLNVLISVAIGCWILATVRVALASNTNLGTFAADLLSIAAGCSAGGLVYFGLVP